MGVMNIYHMDIMDFITAKSKDEKRLNHFNLSVMVDDAFIEAIKNDGTIFLHHPVYDKDGKIENNPDNWIYSKEVKAVDIWNEVMKQAYNTGEPGVLFYDNMNKDNNLWYVENMVCTNPCFSGDMRLLTVDGYKTFEELDGTEPMIVNFKGKIVKSKVWCSGVKDTVIVSTANSSVVCTPNHRFMTPNGECEAQNLKVGSTVVSADYTHHKILSDLTLFEDEVVSVKPYKKMKVYDFEEPETHWGIVEDFVVHNCGEYLAGTVYGNNPITNEPLKREDYGGACNLGSLFLQNFVVEPFTKNAHIDYGELKRTINTAVRFLDNIIDINHFPNKIYENYQKAFRTIGLGVTGLADMLVMMNMKYNSPTARMFVDTLMEDIALNVYKSSIKLAQEKGSFPFCDKNKFIQSGYILKHLKGDRSEKWKDVVEEIKKYGIRNARLISVAPTGTLSLTFGNNCSSGIEPIFSLEYERKVKFGGQSDDDIQIVKMQDYAYGKWLQVKDDPDCIVKKDCFITALEMTVNEHVDMLAKIAHHVDMSVSKTINVPTEYSFEDTKRIYMKCWEYGIKGCTIFRPNEIRQGIMVTDNQKKDTEETMTDTTLPRGFVIQVDNNCIGLKRDLQTGCGKAHLTAFFDPINGQLLETYISRGSTGGCANFQTATSRMISLSARLGADIDTIIDQLDSCGVCPSYAVRTATQHDTSKGSCCPVAIGNALRSMDKEIKDYLGIDTPVNQANIKVKAVETQNKKHTQHYEVVTTPCPECGEPMEHQGGCDICKSCGYTHCE